MALEWVFCPYCKIGEGCFYDEEKEEYTCPTTGTQFTQQQSVYAATHYNDD